MRSPAFWWRDAGLASALLAPLAALYGAVAARRMRRAGRAAGIPVVCVGNLTLGGAGKTPTALAVGEMLQAAGRRPCFLSRGYGGALAGPVMVEPGRHSAREVGDEALLLARLAPTVVARDRVAGAAAARAAGAGIVVLDDGFQNPALNKDRALVVIDARRGIGNGRVFPAGPLRAPLAAQLACAHALLVIGTGEAAAAIEGVARARGLPVFHGRLAPDPAAVAALAGRRVLAFAGIGDPEKFFASLRAAGIDVVRARSFPDHHRYTGAEAAALVAAAAREALDLVTTEKDLARLDRDSAARALAQRAKAFPVRLAVDESLHRFVLQGR